MKWFSNQGTRCATGVRVGRGIKCPECYRCEGRVVLFFDIAHGVVLFLDIAHGGSETSCICLGHSKTHAFANLACLCFPNNACTIWGLCFVCCEYASGLNRTSDFTCCGVCFCTGLQLAIRVDVFWSPLRSDISA